MQLYLIAQNPPMPLTSPKIFVPPADSLKYTFEVLDLKPSSWRTYFSNLEPLDGFGRSVIEQRVEKYHSTLHCTIKKIHWIINFMIHCVNLDALDRIIEFLKKQTLIPRPLVRYNSLELPISRIYQLRNHCQVALS